MEKKKNEFKCREKKLAYQKLSQAQSLEESKKSGSSKPLKRSEFAKKG